MHDAMEKESAWNSKIKLQIQTTYGFFPFALAEQTNNIREEESIAKRVYR